MTEQELINSLNDTEAERVRWMTAALTAGNEVAALKEANETWRKQWTSERYEVEQLKAQVNCLRDALTRLTLAYGDAEYNSSFLVLSSTAEQCLAEVKAKAIEDATICTNDGSGWCFEGDLSRFAKTLREQAK